MKKFISLIKHLPKAVLLIATGFGLVYYSKEASAGVRDGLSLLGSTLIPSLFPFFVFSEYLTKSDAAIYLSRVLKKPVRFLFKASGISSIALIFAATGGYPLGAKTISSLYLDSKIEKNEAQRLMLWCMCPGPAFAVTALGSSILKSTSSGIIIYVSALLSALSLGILCRFLSSGEEVLGLTPNTEKASLVGAVSSAEKAILSVSGWVLTFSCISGITDALSFDLDTKLFIKAVLEVTTGCKACAKLVPIPVIAAAVGFGGVAVICQVLPYLKSVGVSTKAFIASRALNALLSAFYCSLLLKLFPGAESASVTFETSVADFTLSYTAPVCAVLIIMCALFVFQVDNRKKMC